jgi:VanZ family protein
VKNKELIIFPILFMLLIFFLSTIPIGKIKLRIKHSFEILHTIRAHIQKLLNIEIAFSALQNLLHIPFFAFLAFLWMHYFKKKNMRLRKALFYTLAITLIFSVFEESCQFFITGRDATFFDLFLNFFGCLVGISIYMLYLQNNTCVQRLKLKE